MNINSALAAKKREAISPIASLAISSIQKRLLNDRRLGPARVDIHCVQGPFNFRQAPGALRFLHPRAILVAGIVHGSAISG